MPRKARFYLPGVPAHVIQRGNNRQAVFFADEDYQAYLNWLKAGSRVHGCVIHAYVLMTNHVHLLVTPNKAESISRLIQYVGRYYVTYINERYGRSGSLWEGRHKGCAVAQDDHFLACSRYIELNPVRAGMVAEPGAYRWSSYRGNAFGDHDNLLTNHALYIALAHSDNERQHAYRELFRKALDPEQLHDIRATAQTGTPLGNDRFRQEIETALNRKVGQARRGRPSREVV